MVGHSTVRCCPIGTHINHLALAVSIDNPKKYDEEEALAIVVLTNRVLWWFDVDVLPFNGSHSVMNVPMAPKY